LKLEGLVTVDVATVAFRDRLALGTPGGGTESDVDGTPVLRFPDLVNFFFEVLCLGALPRRRPTVTKSCQYSHINYVKVQRNNRWNYD
jgi:hypothetical protein